LVAVSPAEALSLLDVIKQSSAQVTERWELIEKVAHVAERTLHFDIPTERALLTAVREVLRAGSSALGVARQEWLRSKRMMQSLTAVGAACTAIGTATRAPVLWIVGVLIAAIGAVLTAHTSMKLTQLSVWADHIERARKSVWDVKLDQTIDDAAMLSHDAEEMTASSAAVLAEAREQHSSTRQLLKDLEEARAQVRELMAQLNEARKGDA